MVVPNPRSWASLQSFNRQPLTALAEGAYWIVRGFDYNGKVSEA